MLVLRPRPNRDPILLRHQLLKPRVLHPPLQLRPRARIAAEIPRRLQQRVRPLGDRAVGAHGAVFGVVCQFEILEFGVAAGFREGEGLGHEFGPVDDGGGHVAGVDEVEFLGEGPGLFAVVDFELYVCGDPVRCVALACGVRLVGWRVGLGEEGRDGRQTSWVVWGLDRFR